MPRLTRARSTLPRRLPPKARSTSPRPRTGHTAPGSCASMSQAVRSVGSPRGPLPPTGWLPTRPAADRGTGVFEPERPHHVIAFDVSSDGKLNNRGIFATIEPGAPDGLKVDDEGRVYVSSAGGVQVFASYGVRLGAIALPGSVNFCF